MTTLPWPWTTWFPGWTLNFWMLGMAWARPLRSHNVGETFWIGSFKNRVRGRRWPNATVGVSYGRQVYWNMQDISQAWAVDAEFDDGIFPMGHRWGNLWGWFSHFFAISTSKCYVIMHDWLVVWNIFYFFHMLGMSSSQLLLTIIFQRGRL